LAIALVQALVMIAAPFAVAAAWRTRHRLSWDLFLAGGGGFIASQVVHIPILYKILVPWMERASLGLLASSLVVGLAAGLCEEPARWLVFRFLLRGRRSFPEGVMEGLGHGGIECALLGILVLLSLGGALSTGPDSAPVVRQEAAVVLAAPALLRLVAILERAMAMTMHVFMSVLVQRAVIARRPSLLVAAVGVHTLLDSGTVYCGAAIMRSTHSVWLATLIVQLLLAASAAASILGLRFFYIAAPDLRGETSEPPSLPENGAAICARGLSKRFEGRVVVDNLDLDVAPGEVFALLGPNGAGKTTTVRMLAGLIGPAAGSARVAGFMLDHENAELHAHIGILTETPGMYERLSALENLEVFGRLYGLQGEALRAAIEEHLRAFELWDRRHDAVSGFSKGMKQKLAIVRAILHRPSVIFLDEPTSGLDPQAAREVMDMVLDLKKQGRTILLTTHRLEEAEELAGRVGIFRERMLALDTFENLRVRLFGRQVRVRFGGEIDGAWADRVKAMPGVLAVEPSESGLRLSLQDPDRDIPAIVRALVESGAAIRGVEDVEHRLEEIYLQLVGS
jgi:ABC-2 type transport system ATP-binding protein